LITGCTTANKSDQLNVAKNIFILPLYESVTFYFNKAIEMKVKHARVSVASYEKRRQKRKNVKNIIRCTQFNEIFISLIVQLISKL
jgi:hypothetical protein